MIIKQLSVFLENKSGRFTDVTQALAEGNINISAFNVAETSEFGILRMIVNKPDDAYKILKAKNFSVHLTDVIGMIVPHKPGGLYQALKIISEEKIDIEYMYAFAFNDRATVIIRTDVPEKTIETLQKHKMELIRSSQIYEV